MAAAVVMAVAVTAAAVTSAEVADTSAEVVDILAEAVGILAEAAHIWVARISGRHLTWVEALAARGWAGWVALTWAALSEWERGLVSPDRGWAPGPWVPLTWAVHPARRL
jgi:hypothetical protein